MKGINNIQTEWSRFGKNIIRYIEKCISQSGRR